MTTLFRRLKPAQNFRITQRQIAKLLRIPESLIVKVESWRYVLFVHRTDKGGQFISYRQMEQWKNAIACQIQKCSTWQQLEHLWNAIMYDHTKHNCQYDNSVFSFLEKIWTIQAVQTMGADSLKTIREYLGEEYCYEEIQLIQAWWQRKN